MTADNRPGHIAKKVRMSLQMIDLERLSRSFEQSLSAQSSLEELHPVKDSDIQKLADLRPDKQPQNARKGLELIFQVWLCTVMVHRDCFTSVGEVHIQLACLLRWTSMQLNDSG